jgi:hypothetical protein
VLIRTGCQVNALTLGGRKDNFSICAASDPPRGCPPRCFFRGEGPVGRNLHAQREKRADTSEMMQLITCRWFDLGILNLPRCDLRDHDGGADHVGGALLTSGASGHG